MIAESPPRLLIIILIKGGAAPVGILFGSIIGEGMWAPSPSRAARVAATRRAAPRLAAPRAPRRAISISLIVEVSIFDG